MAGPLPVGLNRLRTTEATTWLVEWAVAHAGPSAAPWLQKWPQLPCSFDVAAVFLVWRVADVSSEHVLPEPTNPVPKRFSDHLDRVENLSRLPVEAVSAAILMGRVSSLADLADGALAMSRGGWSDRDILTADVARVCQEIRVGVGLVFDVCWPEFEGARPVGEWIGRRQVDPPKSPASRGGVHLRPSGFTQ